MREKASRVTEGDMTAHTCPAEPEIRRADHWNHSQNRVCSCLENDVDDDDEACSLGRVPRANHGLLDCYRRRCGGTGYNRRLTDYLRRFRFPAQVMGKRGCKGRNGVATTSDCRWAMSFFLASGFPSGYVSTSVLARVCSRVFASFISQTFVGTYRL